MLLLRWACQGPKNVVRNAVRHYYKPKQKDAFFDVEGVVTKDTLLYRYEDVGKVRKKNLVAMTMLPLWAYLGQSFNNTFTMAGVGLPIHFILDWIWIQQI